MPTQVGHNAQRHFATQEPRSEPVFRPMLNRKNARENGAHSGAEGAHYGAVQLASKLYLVASICTLSTKNRADTSVQDVGPKALSDRELET